MNTSPNQEIPDQNMGVRSKIIDYITIISFVIFSISLCATFFEMLFLHTTLWHYANEFTSIEDNSKKNAVAIQSMNEQIKSAYLFDPRKYENNMVKSGATSSTITPFARVRIPNSNSFCRGTQIPISWETSSSVDLVSIGISFPDDIGSFPASYNETGIDDHKGTFMWTVGKRNPNQNPYPSNTPYQVHISAHIPPNLMVDSRDQAVGESSAQFTIIDCAN